MDLFPIGSLMLIIMGASALLIGPLIALVYYYVEEEKLGTIILSLISIAAGLGMLIPGSVKMHDIKYQQYDTKMCTIVSLERDSEISGSFVLGSGHVDTKQYYYFYTVDTEASIKFYTLESVDVKYTRIVEDDSVTPCVYKRKKLKEWEEYYTIFCPVGTIVKEFHA